MKTAMIVKSMAETTTVPHSAVTGNSSLLSPFCLRLMLFARWRHYFPRLIQINYGMVFRMKRPWFVLNLVKL